MKNKKWLNPVGVGALLLVIIFTALIIHNEKRTRTVWEMLPLTTVGYVSIPTMTMATANKFLMNLPFEISPPDFSSLSPEIQEVLARTAVRYGVAKFATDTVLFVEGQNLWDLKKILTRNDEFKSLQLDIDGFTDVYQLPVKINAKSPTYFAILKPYALFCEAEKPLREIIASSQKRQPNLAAYRTTRSLSASAETIEIFTRLPDVFAEICPQGIAAIKATTSFFSDITLNGAQFNANGYLVDIPCEASDNAVVPPSTVGNLFCWLWWLLGMLLCIVIGAPVVFIAIVMLFAGYFHIRSRLQGETVPTVAPQLPDLPAEMIEDLGEKNNS